MMAHRRTSSWSGVDLMVDAHGAFTVAEAQRLAAMAGGRDRAWIADPVSTDEVAGMIAAAARAVRGDVILLCRGGSVSIPEEAAHVLKLADRIHGFYGASSAGRLPMVRAIAEQIRAFNAI